MFKKPVPSIKELRSLAQAKREGIIYKAVDYLAYYPAKLFLYTNITPNQITILWAVIQIISTFFLLKGDYWTTIIALLVYHSMFILDCTDGIVARYKKRFSLNGHYLDDMGHYFANSLLLIFFTIGTYRQHHHPIYLLFGLIALLSYLWNKSLTLNPVLYPEKDAAPIIESSRKSYIQKQNQFFVHIFNFLRLEHFFNLLFWGVVFRIPHLILVFYGSIYFLELMRKLVTQFILLNKIDKARRELAAQEKNN